MGIEGLGSYESAYTVHSGQTPSGSGTAEGTRASYDSSEADRVGGGESTGKTGASGTTEKTGKTGKTGTSDSVNLSEEALALVKELKARDAEVRAHEQAHMAAGGGLTGSASFSYETGPDGKRYAVGGEVSIDSSAVSGDPQATISKMRTVKAAAMAPAQPSAQDLKVAAAAAKQTQQAQQELTLTMTNPQKPNPYAQSADPATSRAVSQFIGVA